MGGQKSVGVGMTFDFLLAFPMTAFGKLAGSIGNQDHVTMADPSLLQWPQVHKYNCSGSNGSWILDPLFKLAHLM